MLALVVYFWPRIIAIARDIFLHKQYRLLRNILLTSIPAGLVGFLTANMIENSAFFGSIVVVIVMSAIVGAIMIVLER